MARPLRLEFAGALYHVTALGNGRHATYLADGEVDRMAFLDVLGAAAERFEWICHAYCLMTNHYHLLVESPNRSLSRGMRQLNGVYTQHVNRIHGRVGHLFSDGSRASSWTRTVTCWSWPAMACSTRFRPPWQVRQEPGLGAASTPGDWPWGSYRATAGETAAPPFLATDPLLRAFADNRADAVARYRRFVAEGIGAQSPWLQLRNQIYLGSEQFVEHMQGMIDPNRPLREVPRRQRRGPAKPLDHYVTRYPDRDQALAEAYRSGAYSMQAIAEHFGMSRATVSRAVKGSEGGGLIGK